MNVGAPAGTALGVLLGILVDWAAWGRTSASRVGGRSSNPLGWAGALLGALLLGGACAIITTRFYRMYSVLAAAVGCVGGAVVGLILGWIKDAGRVRPGFCVTCDYDLTGNLSGVCPECGTPTEPAP